MFFLIFYVVALITATIHLALDSTPRTRERVIDVFLLHLLVICHGLGGIFAFIGHKFRADETARSIGWPTGNPFQEEIAWANLGGGIVGLLCAKQGDGFWSAA